MFTATPEWKGSARESTKAVVESSFGFQFGRLVEYVLNFLDGDYELEKKIFAKALKMYENQSCNEAQLWV